MCATCYTHVPHMYHICRLILTKVDQLKLLGLCVCVRGGGVDMYDGVRAVSQDLIRYSCTNELTQLLTLFDDYNLITDWI